MIGSEIMNAEITPGVLSGFVLSIAIENANPKNHEQQILQPKIDDVVCHFLDGEVLKEALYFIDNVRKSKMKIRWSAVNVWSVLYKRRRVCDIRIRNGSWSIRQVYVDPYTHECYRLYDPESMKRLISTLKDSISGTQEACHASP